MTSVRSSSPNRKRAGRSPVGAATIIRDALRVVGPGHEGRIVLLLVVSVVSAVLESVVLFLIARLATAFSAGSEEIPMDVGPFSSDPLTIWWVLATSAALLFVLFVLSVPLAMLSATVSEHALVRVRSRIISSYLSSSPAHRSQESEGHLQTLIGEHAQRAERVVQQMTTIVVSATGTIVLAAAAVLIAPIPAICGAVAFVAVIWLLRPVTGRVRQGALAYTAANGELLSQMAQTARLGQEIASFEVEDEVERSLRDDVRSGARSLRRMRLTARLTPMLYQYFALALVLAAIAVLAAIDTTDVDFIGPLVLLLVRALGYAKQLQSAIQVGNEFSPYIDEVEAEIAALGDNERPRGLMHVTSIDELVFDDVHFAYVAGVPVLRGVDLRIGRGETVGIVGPSGAGKSTLVELMLRLQSPTGGEIRVDGLELSLVAPEAWSTLVAFVPQENKLIRATVADNIRFYRSGFQQVDIERAARRAHLHEEIVDLPQGYDTFIGPGERSLSGGQRQRLGIARALLGDPSLLVLDEPTSALDARSEELIKQTLVELRGRTTLALVAHRSSTLEVCSRFLVVEDGVVRSSATPVGGVS